MYTLLKLREDCSIYINSQDFPFPFFFFFFNLRIGRVLLRNENFTRFAVRLGPFYCTQFQQGGGAQKRLDELDHVDHQTLFGTVSISGLYRFVERPRQPGLSKQSLSSPRAKISFYNMSLTFRENRRSRLGNLLSEFAIIIYTEADSKLCGLCRLWVHKERETRARGGRAIMEHGSQVEEEGREREEGREGQGESCSMEFQ